MASGGQIRSVLSGSTPANIHPSSKQSPRASVLDARGLGGSGLAAGGLTLTRVVLVVGPSTRCRPASVAGESPETPRQRVWLAPVRLLRGTRPMGPCRLHRQESELKRTRTVPLLFSGPDPSRPTLAAHAARSLSSHHPARNRNNDRSISIHNAHVPIGGTISGSPHSIAVSCTPCCSRSSDTCGTSRCAR